MGRSLSSSLASSSPGRALTMSSTAYVAALRQHDRAVESRRLLCHRGEVGPAPHTSVDLDATRARVSDRPEHDDVRGAPRGREAREPEAATGSRRRAATPRPGSRRDRSVRRRPRPAATSSPPPRARLAGWPRPAPGSRRCSRARCWTRTTSSSPPAVMVTASMGRGASTRSCHHAACRASTPATQVVAEVAVNGGERQSAGLGATGGVGVGAGGGRGDLGPRDLSRGAPAVLPVEEVVAHALVEAQRTHRARGSGTSRRGSARSCAQWPGDRRSG